MLLSTLRKRGKGRSAQPDFTSGSERNCDEKSHSLGENQFAHQESPKELLKRDTTSGALLPLLCRNRTRATRIMLWAISPCVFLDIFALWTVSMACIAVAMLLSEGPEASVEKSVAVISLIGLASHWTARSECGRRTISKKIYAAASSQWLLLFCTLLAKRIARGTGIHVDEKAAVAAIFMSSKQKRMLFGDFLDARHVLPSMVMDAARTTAMSAVLLFLLSVLLKSRFAKTFRYLLIATLFATGSVAIIDSTRDAVHRAFTTSCSFAVPPITMPLKMSMVFVVVDSLRRDMAKELEETLHELRKSTAHHECIEWPQHDSGSVQSDQGFLTLHYAMTAPTDDSFTHHFAEALSWPFETLRSNGYHLHRIEAMASTYCWINQEECDLYQRGFDSVKSQSSEDLHQADRQVLEDARLWLADRAAKGGESPFFLNLDLQSSRFPYLSGSEQKYQPALDKEALYKIKSGDAFWLQHDGWDDAIQKESVRTQLLNRVKNSVSHLDTILAPFVRDTIAPMLDDNDNTLFVLTADHAEFLMEGPDGMLLGHNVPSLLDSQREVPFYLCGPEETVSALRVPDTQLTSHIDVFPSIFEASWVHFDSKWIREIPGRSYFNFLLNREERKKASSSDEPSGESDGETAWLDDDAAVAIPYSRLTPSAVDVLDKGFVVTALPYSNRKVITNGNVRVESFDDNVVSVEIANPSYTPAPNEVDFLTAVLAEESERTWPWSKGGTCDTYEYLEDDLEDDEFDDKSFMTSNHGRVLKSADSMKLPSQVTLNATCDLDDRRHRNHSNTTRFSIDVLSVGSMTRADYARAQVTSWGAHASIRSFVAVSELEDSNTGTCSGISPSAASEYIKTCREMTGMRRSVLKFIAGGAGRTEGPVAEVHVSREGDPGWLCAQRRVALGLKLKGIEYRAMLSRKEKLPDYLLVVDDDTWMNMDLFVERMQDSDPARPKVFCPCMFAKRSYLRWAFPYGGFGSVFSRGAIQRMIQPIHCPNQRRSDTFSADVCKSLERNRIGENKVFLQGMSVTDIFSDYVELENYCLHSDWLTGFMAHYYHLSDRDTDASDNANDGTRLYSFSEWPKCGNHSLSEKCTHNSAVCHRQDPKSMRMLTHHWQVKFPDNYYRPNANSSCQVSIHDSAEAMEERLRKESASMIQANTTSTMDMVAETSKEEFRLPHVLFIGAQKGGSTALSSWLYGNGLCSPKALSGESIVFNKEVHFFDHEDRYLQGPAFFAKRFEHCADGVMTMDATPNSLPHAERVRMTYDEAGGGQAEKLKLIVILRDPVARELSLYNHLVREYQEAKGRSSTRGTWFSYVRKSGGGVKSFDEYVDQVALRSFNATDGSCLCPCRKGLENSCYGLYAHYLQKWFDLFSREQMLVLSYDEMREDPVSMKNRVRKFLNLQQQVLDVIPRENRGYKAVRVAPCTTQARLAKAFGHANANLYELLAARPGPSMEQRPFPAFQLPNCRDEVDKSTEEQESVRFCRFPQDPTVGQPPIEISHGFLVGYQCAGSEYDTCARDANALVKDASSLGHSSSWGRSDIALAPPGSSILFLGNSNTRQIFETVVCQYGENILNVKKLGSAEGHWDGQLSIQMTDGVTVDASTNAALHFDTNWVHLLEGKHGRTLSSFDAIVVGNFNDLDSSKAQNRAFYHNVVKEAAEENITLKEPFDTVPDIADVALHYEGPIIFVSNVFPHSDSQRRSLANARKFQAETQREQHVVVIDGGRYLDAISPCGHKGRMNTVTDEMSSSHGAHRCVGGKGSYADVLAWDVVEAFQQIKSLGNSSGVTDELKIEG